MLKRVIDDFYRLVLGRPLWVLLVVLALLVGAAWQARHFELDASAESLLLQNDSDLQTFRSIRERYGSAPLLFVTFNPKGELFEQAALSKLRSLRDDLGALASVDSVTSILDVPLIQGPDVTFSTLQQGPPTLGDPDVSLAQARKEFLTSPLYHDLVLSDDAETTAMLVRLQGDPRLDKLQQQRTDLRAQRDAGELDAAGQKQLAQVEQAFDQRNEQAQTRMADTVGAIRGVLDQYRDTATVHLGGVPMIAVDMIDFVANDIQTFGVGVGLFIVLLLALAFRRLRWVLVPVVICAGVVLAMVGWIGFMRWPVTVVSSNFISLVLIITLSLIVHLIVRYRELQSDKPESTQPELLQRTLFSKFKPSFFTSLTTAISFASLMFADIRPVMDFGLMMVCSVVLGFVLTFVLFPSLLAPLRPDRMQAGGGNWSERANIGVARTVHQRPWATVVVFVLLTIMGVAGALRLTVENRFIDYFHEDTEIYQGLSLIDRKLGGTTPMDIVIDAPDSFMQDYKASREFDKELGVTTKPTPAEGYWYNARQLQRVTRIQQYLESLDATGKVLSIGTAWQMVLQLNDGKPLEPYELGILYNRVPKDLRQQLIDPYMTEDGNEIRFDIRVIDSLPGLHRDQLIERIRTQLPKRFDLDPEQIKVSGMLVLYNNVLQSLFRSQIVTLAIVFAAIMLMFGALYRSVRMALIGPIPTIVAASLVLGTMGWIGLPLDIMTMTIAAIVIGIGVDDTIHYVDRFQTEVRGGVDAVTATEIAHREIGQAMIYTTLIVTLGFSILTLSNFMPTIYFGLLTGLAMVLALISNLVLLPVLLQRVQPFAGNP